MRRRVDVGFRAALRLTMGPATEAGLNRVAAESAVAAPAVGSRVARMWAPAKHVVDAVTGVGASDRSP